MILKLLLSNQMIWMIFVKTFQNATQIKKFVILIDFDDINDYHTNSMHYFIMKIQNKR